MLSKRFASIAALFASFALMGIGQGLLGSLVGIRATAENFSILTIGAISAGFYLGFIYGTDLCARMIGAVGHIRSFAVCAALAAASVLLMGMFVNPAAWIALRLMSGMCSAGIYVVIESWLNAFATNKDRGRILAFYMILYYMGIALGQGFLLIASPMDASLFMVAAVLFCLSLVPLSASQTRQPEDTSFERFDFRRLYKTSPQATAGCFGVGLILGSFWGLGAVFITQIGMPAANVAMFIVSVLIGGLLLQWPLGMLSDIFNRRPVIALTCLMASLSSLGLFYLTRQGLESFTLPFFGLAVFFGGTNYSLYSLMLSLMNDFLEPRHLVKASSGLLALHALGAVLGPILASGAMAMVGPPGLMLFTGAVGGLLCAVSIIRLTMGAPIPAETSDKFVSIPQTGVAVAQLDPRAHKTDQP